MKLEEFCSTHNFPLSAVKKIVLIYIDPDDPHQLLDFCSIDNEQITVTDPEALFRLVCLDLRFPQLSNKKLYDILHEIQPFDITL